MCKSFSCLGGSCWARLSYIPRQLSSSRVHKTAPAVSHAAVEYISEKIPPLLFLAFGQETAQAGDRQSTGFAYCSRAAECQQKSRPHELVVGSACNQPVEGRNAGAESCQRYAHVERKCVLHAAELVQTVQSERRALRCS